MDCSRWRLASEGSAHQWLTLGVSVESHELSVPGAKCRDQPAIQHGETLQRHWLATAQQPLAALSSSASTASRRIEQLVVRGWRRIRLTWPKMLLELPA